MEIKTGSYANPAVRSLIDRHLVYPVGITRGKPRWPLGYKPQMFQLLAPSYRLLKAGFGQDDFRKALFMGLEENWLAIESGLKAISQTNGLPLILLCFENVAKQPIEDNWCHRTMVGEFIGSKLGITVEEVQVKDLGQPSMFDV
jgi:hypothetical protein